MGDPTRGLYDKFNVSRTDGKSAPGEKHAGCRHFVLDLTHDPHARPALCIADPQARLAATGLHVADRPSARPVDSLDQRQTARGSAATGFDPGHPKDMAMGRVSDAANSVGSGPNGGAGGNQGWGSGAGGRG
jgi:hypothetical protein